MPNFFIRMIYEIFIFIFLEITKNRLLFKNGKLLYTDWVYTQTNFLLKNDKKITNLLNEEWEKNKC
jgi:hypothetical protein